MRLFLLLAFFVSNVFAIVTTQVKNESLFLENAVKIMQQQQQTIHDLQISLQALKAEQVNLKSSLNNSVNNHFYTNSIESHVGETWPSMSQWWVLSLAVIFLWVMLELGDSKPKERLSATDREVDELGEYDFLNTAEGLNSQLDLARAYVEMGDLLAAREAVDLVLSLGNIEQIKQAEIILVDIRSKEIS